MNEDRKKVLIMIQDMDSGGAQKSLISFLKSLNLDNRIKDFHIELIISSHSGIFLEQIPEGITVCHENRRLLWMHSRWKDRRLWTHFSIVGLIGKIVWAVSKKRNRSLVKLHPEQALWECWKKYFPEIKREYDIAISYMNGYPNYYIMEKVKAPVKILWIHNEYQKIGYQTEYDKRYYEQCNKIITISQQCRESFLEVFPQFRSKLYVLQNITLYEEIMKKASSENPPEFEQWKGIRLLSIGRLAGQKGFDLAVYAARLLKNEGYEFTWLFLGEGPERKQYETAVKNYGLEEQVRFLGIRDNPYPYIRQTDIFVQTSRYEGKSIVLDEAKLLAKPIVVTNYPTVADSIEDGCSGLIVDMTPTSIKEGIEALINKLELRKRLTDYLKNNLSRNEQESARYIEIMLEQEKK